MVSDESGGSPFGPWVAELSRSNKVLLWLIWTLAIGGPIRLVVTGHVEIGTAVVAVIGLTVAIGCTVRARSRVAAERLEQLREDPAEVVG